MGYGMGNAVKTKSANSRGLSKFIDSILSIWNNEVNNIKLIAKTEVNEWFVSLSCWTQTAPLNQTS